MITCCTLPQRTNNSPIAHSQVYDIASSMYKNYLLIEIINKNKKVKQYHTRRPPRSILKVQSHQILYFILKSINLNQYFL
jgi:hypothetical protein